VKEEIGRKTVCVALDLLVEVLDWQTVKRSQVRIENDLVATKNEDLGLDSLSERSCLFTHWFFEIAICDLNFSGILVKNLSPSITVTLRQQADIELSNTKTGKDL